MVKTFTVLFMLMVTSVVQAQALAVRVIESECTLTGCRQSIGTGACAYIGNIEDRSVYLTAAHNVLQAKTIYVGYGGQWWGARVVYKDYRDNLTTRLLKLAKSMRKTVLSWQTVSQHRE